MSRIVVLGGTGNIGSKVLARLEALGHRAVPASPSTGVDLLTGDGLAEALSGAEVVIDTSKPHDTDAANVEHFFSTAARTVAAAERAAGVRHHVLLSIVGCDRAVHVPFYRAKAGLERAVRASEVPTSILHATQFFEFATSIAAVSEHDGVVRLPRAKERPVAGDDVADAVVGLALREPPEAGEGTREMELAGPEEYWMRDFVARVLTARGDARTVVEEDGAPYFGGPIERDTLLPSAQAEIARTTLCEWLTRLHP